MTINGMTIKEFLQKITFLELLKGMFLIFKHNFWMAGGHPQLTATKSRGREITFQYPYEKRVLPDRHRGALVLLRYSDGTERCVGCDLCEIACPSLCINVVSEQHPKDPLVRWAKEFYINMTRCIFCGFCVEACPVNALGMTKMYEYSTSDKRTLIFDKEKLYTLGDALHTEAKQYLYAHNQETEEEKFVDYRYRFPASRKT